MYRLKCEVEDIKTNWFHGATCYISTDDIMIKSEEKLYLNLKYSEFVFMDYKLISRKRECYLMFDGYNVRLDLAKETAPAFEYLRSQVNKYEQLIEKTINEYNSSFSKEWDSFVNSNMLIKSNQSYYHSKLSSREGLNFGKWISYDNDSLFFSNDYQSDSIWSKEKIQILNHYDSKLCGDFLSVLKERIDCNNVLDIIEVPYNKVCYFDEKGTEELIQRVSGQGGGFSVGGAIVGGLIAGGVGALIGSRKETTIKTEEEIVDTRYIDFRYYDSNNKLRVISLPYEAKQLLISVIPDKEYSVVNGNIENKHICSNEINEKGKLDSFDMLVELKKLLDVGAITEEEFLEKKKELLSRI